VGKVLNSKRKSGISDSNIQIESCIIKFPNSKYFFR